MKDQHRPSLEVLKTNYPFLKKKKKKGTAYQLYDLVADVGKHTVIMNVLFTLFPSQHGGVKKKE
jgi:hypothetical protein